MERRGGAGKLISSWYQAVHRVAYLAAATSSALRFIGGSTLCGLRRRHGVEQIGANGVLACDNRPTPTQQDAKPESQWKYPTPAAPRQLVQ
jgi:hypothetical protein